MKKLILSVAAIAFIFTINSCDKSEKDPDPVAPELTRKQTLGLLRDGVWVFDKQTLSFTSPFAYSANQPLKDCEKDNTLYFATDSTAISDEGLIKCDEEVEQSETDTYVLSADGKSIVLGEDTLIIKEVSKTYLLLEFVYKEEGVSGTVVMGLRKQ